MTVGDIKIEALRLMFAELDPLINAESVSDYENSDTIGTYLAAMPGSINRCLSNITSRRILPEKSKNLLLSDDEQRMGSYRFDLSGMDDFYDVSRVTVQSEQRYDGNAPYRMEGKTLVLLNPCDDATVTLLYYPRLALVKPYENTKELDIPDEIAAVIPYFIKGEVYREDEINDAGEAMLWYEQRLAELESHRTEVQGHTVSVYSQVML